MSEEQVEVVREHIEAYRRQDTPVAFSLMDPHAVLDMSRIDGSDPCHGHQAIEEWVTRFRGTFEDQHLATLYTVIDGKIARITTFRSEQEALEAAGLSA